MIRKYKFENLTVWERAIGLSQRCYQISLDLPTYERNGLGDQLRRSASSIFINIAEGSGSESDKEFSRFLYISRKSLFETIAILKFVEKVHPRIELDAVYEMCNETGKLLNGLINKLQGTNSQ